MNHRRWLWRLAMGALVAQLTPALQAQIHADPAAPAAQQPTVLRAPNGVPLVNITTPSGIVIEGYTNSVRTTFYPTR